MAISHSLVLALHAVRATHVRLEWCAVKMQTRKASVMVSGHQGICIRVHMIPEPVVVIHSSFVTVIKQRY